MHITNLRYATPQVLTPFCSVLRKHLRNGVLTGISQQDLDRVAIIGVKSGPGEYKLIVELLDKGKIILTDANLTIIATNDKREKTTRSTAKGATYLFPKIRGLDLREANSEEAFKLIHDSKSDAVRTLVRFLNLPGEIAEEVCLQASVDKTVSAQSLTVKDVELLLESGRRLALQIENESLEPVLARNESELETVLPRKLRAYEGSQTESFNSFSEALDRYFEELSHTARAHRKEEVEGRWQHIIAEQSESAQKLLQEAKQDRERASTIFANLSQLEPFLSSYREELNQSGNRQQALRRIQEESEKNLQFMIEAIDPRTGKITIRISDTLLELESKEGAAANASLYYQRAKEAEAKAKRATDSIEETRRKLAGATETAEKQVEEKKTIARTHWYERFRWFISTEQCLVIGGRDAAQNETLIKKHVEPSDIVVHADVQGAPFVIVKNDRQAIGESTLDEAAQFAVAYSSAWKGGLGSADAYWVKPDQVSKSAPSGEYIGRGAFMVRGEKNFRRRLPLRLSIGVDVKEGVARIVGGPGSAIRTHSQVSVSLAPGDILPERLAPQLRYRLAKMLPEEVAVEVKRLDDSEFIRFLPQGGSHLEESNS